MLHNCEVTRRAQRAPRQRIMLKHSIQNIAMALAALPLLLACSGDAKTPAGPGRPGGAAPTPVILASVVQREWSDQIEALGTARANESVTLTAKVSDTVREVHFEDGDQVEAGAILVSLTDRAEVAELREAQAAMREADRQFRRLEEIVASGTVTRSDLDVRRAERERATARMQALEARLADRVLLAPFAGVLGFRQISTGSLVSPGAPIATLDDLSVIKLDFTIPERYLATLAVGQSVAARSAAWPDADFQGTVSSIDSRIDPVTRTVVVRALIPNQQDRLRPGMLLTVNLSTAPRSALVVPEIALSAEGRETFAFRYGPESTVERVPVVVGARRGGEVEVLEGLAVGDQVVTDGLVRVRHGSRVTVLDPPSAA